tara:strand:- start:1450 stop:1689 length:240 start_codon:yes stop_codon:yes gene_type:complete
MLFQEYFTLDELTDQVDQGVYDDPRHLTAVLAAAVGTSHLDFSAALKILDYFFQGWPADKAGRKKEMQKWVNELQKHIN